LKSNHTLSQEVHVDIPNLSVETMEFKGKILPGFTLHSTLNLEPSLDIHAAIAQPKESAEKMKGMIHLSIEKELLEYLKKDPETMLFYMMYRPKREDEQRVYDIHIDHGSLIVNDKPVEL
ncbi:MAG: hypothetical protein RL113_1384, partial [Pseudomonadota bacterium]